ncbi:hypothetical protein JNB88_07685 [Rhizobium cauense]|uniref:hypothetical protein n=1 Tax=Rhizobium cauense TaxID=1166683 RepID=UPI001C6EC553|nr:hypothetical protein [Rhizobium cauense]MBW9113522.1 hypothetical protein [Rhizobium cauense]
MTKTEIMPPPDDPSDRCLRCQEALEEYFLQLVRSAVPSRWSKEEVAVALAELADHNVLSILAYQQIENDLQILKSRKSSYGGGHTFG